MQKRNYSKNLYLMGGGGICLPPGERSQMIHRNSDLEFQTNLMIPSSPEIQYLMILIQNCIT